MKWSAKHQKAIPINHTVADTFELFVKGLISKPAVPVFDFDLLEEKLIVAAKQTVSLLLRNHPQDNFVSFGFYTNEDGSMIGTAANTGQHLNHMLADNRSEQDFYTYTTTEWKYEGTDDADCCSHITGHLEDHIAFLFTDSAVRTFRKQLMNCCVNALCALREEGFFTDRFDGTITLMVGTCEGDIPKARVQQIIKLLNPSQPHVPSL